LGRSYGTHRGEEKHFGGEIQWKDTTCCREEKILTQSSKKSDGCAITGFIWHTYGQDVGCSEQGNESLGSIKCQKFLNWLLKKDSAP
jgi:hypothetical protein